MTAPARFTQADVTRAMKGAREGGFTRVRVAIDEHGGIVIDAWEEAAPAPEHRPNPVDRVLRR